MHNTLRVFFISGALAGLGGAIELTALTRRLFLNFSPGYGYTAIAVALLAKLNPLVTVAAALAVWRAIDRFIQYAANGRHL